MPELISTYTGKVIDILKPKPENIDIKDIAHALSLLCRFTGQCDSFYSVAQHSIVVHHLVPDELKLEALLHDAAEAYLGDLSSPVKNALREGYGRSDFDTMENDFYIAISEKFNLVQYNRAAYEVIHQADMVALATERRDICTFPSNVVWDCLKNVVPMKNKIYLKKSWEAEMLFTSCFNEWKRTH